MTKQLSLRRSSWVSTKGLRLLRIRIEKCPIAEWQAEGLACLRNVKQGDFLVNLIRPDCPARVGLILWLTRGD